MPDRINSDFGFVAGKARLLDVFRAARNGVISRKARSLDSWHCRPIRIYDWSILGDIGCPFKCGSCISI